MPTRDAEQCSLFKKTTVAMNSRYHVSYETIDKFVDDFKILKCLARVTGLRGM